MTTVLIANRGAIASHAIDACRRLGVRSVAVCSAPDRDAVHVRRADSVVDLGGEHLTDSYQNREKVLKAIVDSEADLVYPGYGLLAEDPMFVAELHARSVRFAGPPAAALGVTTSKDRALDAAGSAGVPVLPHARARSAAEVAAFLERYGAPIVVKPAGGRGGVGIEVVADPAECASAYNRSVAAASSLLGTAEVYLERYLPEATLVEVQVVADAGTVRFLGQRLAPLVVDGLKLVEESAAGRIAPGLAAALRRYATQFLTALRYQGLATVEFLVAGEDGYFLECNSRIQMAHRVTQAVTGVDLVELQLALALGESSVSALPPEPDLAARCAVEGRVFVAVDDESRSLVGRTGRVELPGDGATIVDCILEPETDVYYDPLLCKVTAAASDRGGALAVLLHALRAVHIEGIAHRQTELESWVRDQATRGNVWEGDGL
jgi:acetyl/propionyl-CoA carboxylase alpha subunit